ncbi:hypothetical protein IEQ34_015969 [Dendrobium chrysotoxum]|uniref:Uncharacterized protein n=1 Tax=Dendrobium chrysotoxum TaxID=161865 RepID=A0AAV7GI88_DENCH|nr:hypothetical protein IEQ34_015969 [Dendrobium chrysotoxum]
MCFVNYIYVRFNVFLCALLLKLYEDNGGQKDRSRHMTEVGKTIGGRKDRSRATVIWETIVRSVTAAALVSLIGGGFDIFDCGGLWGMVLAPKDPMTVSCSDAKVVAFSLLMEFVKEGMLVSVICIDKF